MKTSIEITDSIFQTLENAQFGLSNQQKSILRVCMSEWIKTVKQEQGRDTRHACAKIISSFTDQEIVESKVISIGEAKVYHNFKHKAYTEIMNTKAL